MTLDQNMEHLPPERWADWHSELLVTTVNRVYQRVPFYRSRMDEMGVTPEDILSVEQLGRLPFTTRDDLSRNYPYDFFAVPLKDVVRIHAFRTTGKNPIVLGYTSQDMEHRLSLLTRFLTACGVGSEDIVQICLDSGMSAWGMEIKEGAEAVGALVIPPDPVNVMERLKVLADFKTTVLVTTPSYGLHMLKRMEMASIPVGALALKKMICVGENLSASARKAFKEQWSVDVHSAYGILELLGPAMAYECAHHSGLHLALDQFIPEIVDPDSGAPLPEGETGELVITTLTTRANPLIRFRTGDLTALLREPCRCGRTTWRMAPVERRCDGLISVRGVKFGTEAVRELLASAVQGDPPPFLVVLREEEHLTKVELWTAIGGSFFSGSLPELHRWCRRFEETMEEHLGISFHVKPVEYRTIAPYIEKGRKVIRKE